MLSLNQSMISNDSPPDHYLEMTYTVNNLKNTFKINEVLVQLIQVVAVKEDDSGGNEIDPKAIVKHV